MPLCLLGNAQAGGPQDWQSRAGYLAKMAAGEVSRTQRRMLATEPPCWHVDSVKVDMLVKASWPQGV